MNKQVTFRPYEKQDFAALSVVIRKTWNFDKFCSADTARKLSHVYLAACLADQHYTQVALIDNKPVGIIMARKNQSKNRNLALQTGFLYHIIKLCIKKEGRQTAKFFSHVQNIDTDLLKRAQKSFDGELAFFAVNENYRGYGLGKSLFEKALTFFQQEQVKNFYLYTDTSCNYGFYEHQGMQRLANQRYQLPVTPPTEMEFYLYEYQF